MISQQGYRVNIIPTIVDDNYWDDAGYMEFLEWRGLVSQKLLG